MSAGPLSAAIYLLVENWNADWGAIVLQAIFVPMLLAAVLLPFWALGGSRRWVRFDRRTDLMTITRRQFRLSRPCQTVQSRPLAQIVCVQLLHGGLHATHEEIGEPGTPGSVYFKQYRSYQLNLVLDDGAEPRINLACHSDCKWMREAGEHLAAFLEIPVIDMLSECA
jgi:hypothetical protein